MRATSASLALALFVIPAFAQGPAQPAVGAGPVAAPGADQGQSAAPAQPQRVIRRILVTGTQRVEPGTVLTYVNMQEGQVYDPASADQALKALFATGLFTSATRFDFDDTSGTLTIHVVENPIINTVAFEGNSKISDKDLTKEVQVKARSVFTRAKVEADVQRIVELYRKRGKFAAVVDPQIIQRPQNRVDLIFAIKEGPTTGISRIFFVGNKVFGDSTLKGQIATTESAWWKILSESDNYDPDRVLFDRELLRRYYVNRGYAEFKVLSAVAQLAPDRKSFYLTFTVNEGPKYKFGKVTINSSIKDLTPQELRPEVPITSGDTFDAELLQQSLDAITNAAGNKGYAFAQVHPRSVPNPATRTVDVTFNIDQGPRVYIEKITISGNTRTLDKVIRRQMRLQEGDAFNQVLIDRSRTRIRGLGFFSDVDIKNAPGSEPDRTDVTVAVTEQSTGQVELGLGYASASGLVGQFSYTELNMFGRGQSMTASMQISQIQKQYQFSFTEPWFLDRPLSTGIDLFKTQTDYQQATYRSDTTGFQLRAGFPISEYAFVQLHYSYQVSDITPFSNAPLEVRLAAGNTYGSILGFTYSYSDVDIPQKPTKGMNFSFSQDFAGFGGNMRFLHTEASFSTFHPFFDDAIIGSLTFNAGYITGYDGTPVPITQRFFKGASSFRGFSLAGVGPRDLAVANNTGAIGGNVYAIGTVAARLPSLLPESYGITLGPFIDFGTVGRIDNVIRTCTVLSCIKDNLAFRASAGVSIQWKSGFLGTVQIDLALPLVKAPYDRPQIINFSGAAGVQ